LGLFFLPAGFAMAVSRQPIVTGVLTAMTFNFNPLLAPTNEMNYDTTQYYNSALAIVVGCGVAPLAFLLLPPLSPALRARRLLALTSRDLRRLATAPVLPTPDYWERRIYSRLIALPDQAAPLQRTQLLAALSVGVEIIGLRQMAAHLGTTAELDAALHDIALGHSTKAIAKLRQFDDRLASTRETGTEASMALRGRGRVLDLHGIGRVVKRLERLGQRLVPDIARQDEQHAPGYREPYDVEGAPQVLADLLVRDDQHPGHDQRECQYQNERSLPFHC